MAHPIYRFGEILRELRRGAGLTVLGAAEATEYGNYERWDSGVTRVGAQHLGAIAEAFAVDDVAMFVYAWLVDRFSPMPKQGAVEDGSGGRRAGRRNVEAARCGCQVPPPQNTDPSGHRAVPPPRRVTPCWRMGAARGGRARSGCSITRGRPAQDLVAAGTSSRTGRVDGRPRW